MSAIHSYFSKLQYLAWFDFFSFFIIIGPTMLIFLAANGLQPMLKDNAVNVTNKQTIITPFLLYNADRNMTIIEYQIVQRVRIGCGRLYTRSFVEQWGNGHLIRWAFGLLLFAIVILPVSALLFLLSVPGHSMFARLVPLVHLSAQIISISCCLMGNHILSRPSLCFLNKVWSNLPVQIVLPVMSALICFTYKLYEIRIIILFCQEHLSNWLEEDILEHSPSGDVARLVAQLTDVDQKKYSREEENIDILKPGENYWRSTISESSDADVKGPPSKVTVTLTAPMN